MDLKMLHSCWRNMKDAITLVLSVWTSPPSPRFVVRFVCHFRETENEAHLFCQTGNKNSTKFCGKISFFSALFVPLKRAANVRVISPNGLHIPSPTIGRGEAFCALERLWLKFTSFDRVALHISPEHNAQTLWQETKCRKFLNSEIKGCFAKKILSRGKGRIWRIF